MTQNVKDFLNKLKKLIQLGHEKAQTGNTFFWAIIIRRGNEGTVRGDTKKKKKKKTQRSPRRKALPSGKKHAGIEHMDSTSCPGV